jgi:hypothetical protein
MYESLMLNCEKKIGEDWKGEVILESAKQTSRGTCSPLIRCPHCHGAIHVEKSWGTDRSPQDHFEHNFHDDSEGCIGGYYHNPKEEHKMSTNPIL